jgi:hypothetical protein
MTPAGPTRVDSTMTNFIYGESTDLNARFCTIHEKYDSWVREAGGKDLFFATHVRFGATAAESG